jgi:hypothetical protein
LMAAAHGQRRSVKKSGAVTTSAWRSFPSLLHPSLRLGVRVRNYRWGNGGGELRHACPDSPPLLFIAQCDRGPPTIVGLGAPDQGTG